MPSYIVCFVFKQATLYTNEMCIYVKQATLYTNEMCIYVKQATLYTNEMCIYVKQFEQINIYEIFCHIWEKEVYERGCFKRILIC